MCRWVCACEWKFLGGQISLELELEAIVSYLIRCWEQNLGPLQEQYMCLSIKPSLQANNFRL